MPRTLRTIQLALLGATLLVLGGCGVLTARNLDFPNAETGEDGQTYLLDDLRDIADDTTLSNDEKRQALRDLGIEDEDLIDALLQL